MLFLIESINHAPVGDGVDRGEGLGAKRGMLLGLALSAGVVAGVVEGEGDKEDEGVVTAWLQLLQEVMGRG